MSDTPTERVTIYGAQLTKATFEERDSKSDRLTLKFNYFGKPIQTNDGWETPVETIFMDLNLHPKMEDYNRQVLERLGMTNDDLRAPEGIGRFVVNLVLEEETYRGNTSFRPKFVNEYRGVKVFEKTPF